MNSNDCRSSRSCSVTRSIFFNVTVVATGALCVLHLKLQDWPTRCRGLRKRRPGASPSLNKSTHFRISTPCEDLSELYYESSCLFNWIDPFGLQNLSQDY